VLVLCLAGRFDMARGVLARAGEMGARDSEHPSAGAWHALGRACWAAWHDGDAWTALREARDARSAFAEMGDARHARFAQLFVAMGLWSLGMLDDAEQELRALPTSGGEHLMATIAALFLTTVLIDRGALAEARWLLGEIAALAGDAAAAERELAASLEGLRVSPIVWQIAASRLASVWLAAGRVDEALALAREAREAQRAQGGQGQRGSLVRLVHAEALAAAGRHEAARAELREAQVELLARADRIGDAAVRQAYLSVPEHARLVALAGREGEATGHAAP